MAKRTEVTCQKCGRTKKASSFLPTYSKFFPFGTVDICTDCIEDMIDEENGSLNFISKICQWLDVPLKTEIWGPLYKNNGAVAITTYVKMVLKDYYPSVDWSSTEEYYQELLKERRLEEAVPEIQELKLEKLREKWGEEYTDKEILHLEDLYQGILQTQNVNGKLQTDDAIKLCKISHLLDCKIRDGEDFDKILKSYDTLKKSADFTPKNVKNACDFDSVGELFAYCEKKKWENTFYDNTPRDTVDLVMKDIQSWLRNLYKNETGIAEDVERRIKALQIADEMEDSITMIEDDGLDEFEGEAYMPEEFDEEAGL